MIKKKREQMSFDISKEEKDALMRAAFYTLTRNFTKTVPRIQISVTNLFKNTL